jgi:hypothetical protein
MRREEAEGINPTPWQSRVLAVPSEYNLFLGGGRGGGKSFVAMLDVLRHCELHGSEARPLVVRMTFRALSEMEENFEAMCLQAYGARGYARNRADHMFRLSNGAVVEFAALDHPSAYTRHQGKSYTHLLVDEYGLLREPRWVRLLKSNLRAAQGIPLRTVYTANPGGPQNAALHHDHVTKAPAWTPYEIDGEMWVNCPSTLRDNPLIDQDAYIQRLRASVGNDEDLLKAWLTGDFGINRGAYFAGVLDPRVHQIGDLDHRYIDGGFISLDWGYAAPAVCLLFARTRHAMNGMAADSLVVLDEVSTHDPNDLNSGTRMAPGALAEAIIERCDRWNMYPQGVADDAMGLQQTLVELLSENGIYVSKPRKERVAGWAAIRELLVNARDRNGAPGLFISQRCEYLWATLPFLTRNERRPEDLDTTGPDHAADALRYGVLHSRQAIGTGRTIGHY